MKKYIGTKEVKAQPMTAALAASKGYRVGVHVNEDGYEVEYEGGYKSWSPKEVFEEAYREVDIFQGQSGVFESETIKTVLIGGTNSEKSSIIYGIDDVTVNGVEMKGISFVRSSIGNHNTSEIVDENKHYRDEKYPSFIYVPRTKDAVKYLIESLEWLKDNMTES